MLGRLIETLLGEDRGSLILEPTAPTWKRDTAFGIGPSQPVSEVPTSSGQWQLRGRSGPDAPVHEVSVSSFPFTIGRRAENTLALNDPTVSGLHAEILVRGTAPHLRDLGSTNGTFVNGVRLTGEEPIRDRDVVQFGSARYVVGYRGQVIEKETVTVDVADEALAHLLFDRLLKLPAVQPQFQPIVRLSDGRRIGFEILARSDLPGLETPGKMFRVAAECGREADLSELLRLEGLRSARMLGRFADFYLNTHPAELNRPELLASLERLRTEFPERRIVLEVHEAAVTSTRTLAELKARLAALDIRLAYDDFGAGQSRLMELAEAPPHVLKFDMHLIRGIATASAERRRLVRSLVEVVRGLRVIPLAEGIETADEATACRDLGFELAQGYFYGRPALADIWRKL